MSFIKGKLTIITAVLLCAAAIIISLIYPQLKPAAINTISTTETTVGTPSKVGVEITNGIQYKTIPIEIGEEQFTAEIADTDALRELGLGKRSGLESKTGMLFVFDHSGRYAFWMKDMSFSIDMIWLDESGTIVTIASDVSPQTYPEAFNSTGDAKYVLEVAANTATMEKIKKGDRLIFDKTLLKNSSN